MVDYDKKIIMRMQVLKRVTALNKRSKEKLHVMLGIPYKVFKKLVDNPTPEFYKIISELYLEFKFKEITVFYNSLKNDVSKPYNIEM